MCTCHQLESQCFASSSLFSLFFLWFVSFVPFLILLEGFWDCCTWSFRTSLDDCFDVQITFSIHPLLSCSQFSATKPRTCLHNHGGVRSLKITCAWTQPSWSRRRSTTSTSRAAVLSKMVRTHAISDLAVATYATTSVSTSVSSSVQYATFGTLCWKSIDESKSYISVGHLAQSTLSTGTSFVPSTHSGISISKPSIHSTMLTLIAMSTNSSGLAKHSIHSIIPASSSWHPLCQFTWRSNNGWWQPHLWLWSQSSLARGQRPLRQSENQWPDFSSLHPSIGLHTKTGHWGMWSSKIASGSLVVSAGKQLLASEAGSWAWSLLDSHWGHRSCCVHDGALDTTPQQGGGHGQSRLLQSQAGWETTGQDQQHQVRSPAGCRSYP